MAFALCTGATYHFIESGIELTELQEAEAQRKEQEESEEGKLYLANRWLDYIESFEAGRILGIGGYGWVQLFQHNAWKETRYAVKCVFKSSTKAQAFTQEREMLKLCQGLPFVVKFFGSAQTTKLAFIATQYCPGGDMHSLLLRRRYLTEAEVKFYLCQLIVVAESIHSKQLIFRDFKLENVLIDVEGNLCVADFGSCIKQTFDGHAYSSAGTRCYHAPELLHKLSRIRGYTNDVDWWAIGCIAYELLMGKAPFGSDHDSAYDIYTRIRKHRPPLSWLRLSAACRDFVWSILNPKRSQRLKTPNLIKSHPWFLDVDWDLVKHKGYLPPFTPRLVSEHDYRYFPQHLRPSDISVELFKFRAKQDVVREGMSREKTSTATLQKTLRSQKASAKVYTEVTRAAELSTEEKMVSKAEEAALWQAFSNADATVVRKKASGGLNSRVKMNRNVYEVN